MMASRTWTADDLPILREQLAGTLGPHLQNLTRTYGSFVGMNTAVRQMGEAGEGLSGPGTGTINTMLMDQLHLLAIRLLALISEPRFPTDITLQSFRAALNDEGIRERILEDVASWPGVFSFNDAAVRRRIENVERKFIRIEQLGPGTLTTFRNKVLAHSTTEGGVIEKPMIGPIWRMARAAISIGYDLRFTFDGHVPGYLHEGRFARDDGRALIEILRANQQADG